MPDTWYFHIKRGVGRTQDDVTDWAEPAPQNPKKLALPFLQNYNAAGGTRVCRYKVTAIASFSDSPKFGILVSGFIA